ncbi:TerD family protein [Actinoplanes aureus]|uniref:TerD family protein n=1 Tax=Actinoplanes aureus TaxID=2792083 RepID=A0A931G4W3_9ACTN|nr:TerD family protein [Actinoplanes aureus]MBG0568336.1 TerD family protein [Actinoplanes aureus]
MDALERIGFDRLGLVVTPGSVTTPGVSAPLLAEFAHVGVRFANPEAITDGLAGPHRELIAHVRAGRGGSGTYAPLFPGFPERLPWFDDAVFRFVVARARMAGNDWSERAWRDALDFSRIGWWPASSIPQDRDRAEADRRAQRLLPRDSRIEWITVRLVEAGELETRLRDWMRDCFTSAASLREDVQNDLGVLVNRLGLDGVEVGDVRFRENRTLLFELIWAFDRKRLPYTGATPDDLLRLFAKLAGGDVSLTAPVTFPRLSRADRRVVVNTLEASDRLGDVFRRRGLWLAIDRGLHVGEFRAPRVRETLAVLRESRHDYTSFPSRFERALAQDHTAAVRLAAAEAPGLLGRGLRRLAALATGPEQRAALVGALTDSRERIPLRVLLAAGAQLADNGRTYPRVVFGKDGSALPIVRERGHLAVPKEFREDLLGAVDAAVDARIAAKGDWHGESVWVEPGLDRLLLPDQLRATAAGLVQVERGSRLPVGEAEVVRLFVHWREADRTSDLDLSCIALDAGFRIADQVSWTNLGNGVMTHSGDLTSAPDGAEEFLDINLAKAARMARRKGWRYLVPVIFRYAGPAFEALAEAYTGWMSRNDATSRVRVFDPATVANAFPLTGRKRYAVPMLLDLDTHEILYVDVYLNGRPRARVEQDGNDIATLVSAVAGRRDTKVSVADLAMRHVRARGATLVDDRSRATITFGTGGGCTYDVLRPEKLLADLL